MPVAMYSDEEDMLKLFTENVYVHKSSDQPFIEEHNDFLQGLGELPNLHRSLSMPLDTKAIPLSEISTDPFGLDFDFKIPLQSNKEIFEKSAADNKKQIAPPATPEQQLGAKRKSHSWAPQAFKASYADTRRTKSLKHFPLSSTGIQNIDSRIVSPRKQRRIKWSDEEIRDLWKGIQEYGNEWREIKNLLPKRTYHQVKDKGRRLLQQEFWKTGRSKLAADGACEFAKDIAEAVLKR
mmetsp:Transcript_12130/g.15080  ORF Transcript_12130/g.15080 Transcript_12130/m.15080 type:complete len:237 (+) Transcript_12130:359-1069(+)|eukprot:CAMPEP_0204847812 /NCGR_PEP_ID=MMETSP1347-20130617/3048_1 /ASSEMBLY_ACC=CAM_ASM_000690 /TAXON_ID=215587 /ORGANISM="Aplanochytrium stocchinoi, Strain GSBS06" /LENGTH=236 /DNA_ID=CAMNT_0051988967 /DNA_START=318 /DNA_END=1028 /DNA_ORIENTATION=-